MIPLPAVAPLHQVAFLSFQGPYLLLYNCHGSLAVRARGRLLPSDPELSAGHSEAQGGSSDSPALLQVPGCTPASWLAVYSFFCYNTLPHRTAPNLNKLNSSKPENNCLSQRVHILRTAKHLGCWVLEFFFFFWDKMNVASFCISKHVLLHPKF